MSTCLFKFKLKETIIIDLVEDPSKKGQYMYMQNSVILYGEEARNAKCNDDAEKEAALIEKILLENKIKNLKSEDYKNSKFILIDEFGKKFKTKSLKLKVIKEATAIDINSNSSCSSSTTKKVKKIFKTLNFISKSAQKNDFVTDSNRCTFVRKTIVSGIAAFKTINKFKDNLAISIKTVTNIGVYAKSKKNSRKKCIENASVSDVGLVEAVNKNTENQLINEETKCLLEYQVLKIPIRKSILSLKDQLLYQKLNKRGIHFSENIDKNESFSESSLQTESSLDLATRILNFYSNCDYNTNLNAQNNESTNKNADDENKYNEKPIQCKDHSPKITCLKCININCGAKIKKLTKYDGHKIYGFV